MIKGYKNDPAWRAYFAEVKKRREDAMLEKLHTQIELEQETQRLGEICQGIKDRVAFWSPAVLGELTRKGGEK